MCPANTFFRESACSAPDQSCSACQAGGSASVRVSLHPTRARTEGQSAPDRGDRRGCCRLEASDPHTQAVLGPTTCWRGRAHGLPPQLQPHAAPAQIGKCSVVPTNKDLTSDSPLGLTHDRWSACPCVIGCDRPLLEETGIHCDAEKWPSLPHPLARCGYQDAWREARLPHFHIRRNGRIFLSFSYFPSTRIHRLGRRVLRVSLADITSR